MDKNCEAKTGGEEAHLHHARPDGAPPASRLQVEHVDGRWDRRQAHLQFNIL